MPTREENILESLKIAELCEIKKLYRYRSMESLELEGIFKKREIYLPKPIDFNDPFECLPSVNLQMSKLKRELYLKELIRRKFLSIDRRAKTRLIKDMKVRLISDDFPKDVYDNFLKGTGIYCLSEKCDDILMWSHYSNGHKGLCLEFDPVYDAIYNKRTLFSQSFQVIYSTERPVLNIDTIGEPEGYKKALLTKSKHWDYEKEWRIIKTSEEGGPGIKKFKSNLLTGVIFGAMISVENRKKIMDLISIFPSKLSLYQAKINETKYQIDIEPIE